MTQDRTSLLVSIARLYYEHGYSQQMISEKLGLSRPYVSKLINEARACGIVDIRIRDPVGAESAMETEMRDAFGLDKAIIVPVNDKQENSPQERAAQAAAAYIDKIIKSGDILGVAWGRTLYALSRHLAPRTDLQDIAIAELCGGISNIEYNIYASEILSNFANALGGVPYLIPAPAIVDSHDTHRVMVKDSSITSVLSMAKRANISVITTGAYGTENVLIRGGYLGDAEQRELMARGAVGDICARPIDIQGRPCKVGFASRIIAIELEDLAEKETKIALSVGKNKALCTLGALRGNYINVLVTDEETAREILKQNEGKRS